MSKVIKGITSVASIALIWLIYALWLPPMSLSYVEGFLFFFVCGIIILCNIAMWIYEADEDLGEHAFIIVAAICGVVIAVALVVVCAGSALFNHGAMYRQLGEVETLEYDEMIKQIDIAQIPIVDEELAKKQADKKIGEEAALGSRVDLDEPAMQEVNGEIVFVTPLKHTDFFKWNTYHSTPGYIIVSASNPNKVEFVTEIDGEKIEIQYQESAFFGYDLKRHIRQSGYNEGLTEYTFEIDDSGRPYWVVTTYRDTTFWSNPEATGVVIVDAQTGKTEWYACSDAPDWVDIIQPKSFIENQIDNWGTLIHGVFNWSNQDKIKKTELTLPVYVNGDCYYFTGMTSVGNDESCVGFIMVNTRDKKAMISYMSGATENAAMKSAEGLVSDFGYISTEPLPLNVNGIPTYVMALKDEEGLIKSYAMVNIENYSITAKGNSLIETSRSYMQAVAKSGSNYVVGSQEAYGYTYEGIVQRISSTVEDGSTYYYIVVEGEPEKIFTASYLISDELAITRDGDTVKIEYIDDKNGTVDITSFDNIAFATPKSEDQERREEFDEGTSALDSVKNQIIQVNPDLTEEAWESLSEEEKAKLISEFLSNNK